jgi:hypothetical protein
VLVLGNGRRIESGWRFADAEFIRLIRLAEKARCSYPKTYAELDVCSNALISRRAHSVF